MMNKASKACLPASKHALFLRQSYHPGMEKCLCADEAWTHTHTIDLIFLITARDEHCADQTLGHDFNPRYTLTLIKEDLSSFQTLFYFGFLSKTSSSV